MILNQDLCQMHTSVPSNTRLYFIHNTSKQSIWLVHEKKHPSASAGWTSMIDSNRWTAILMSKPCFPLSCHLVSAKGPYAVVNCPRYVELLPATAYSIPKQAMGNSYWVVENVSKSDLSARLRLRGFVHS